LRLKWPPARREEGGAYLNRYVTDEQRSRRPIFIATLWAAAGWLFFRVARSSRIDSDMLVARALKNSQLTCGERHAYFGDRTLDRTLATPVSLLPSFPSVQIFFPSNVDPVYGFNPTAGLARGRILGLVISLCAAVEHLRLS